MCGLLSHSIEETTVRKLLALIDSTNTWIGKVVCILSLVVAFIISYEIFVRQVLVKPTVWVSEGTVFGCGLLYLLGGAWTLKQDGHVRVDMLYHGLSRRGKAIIDCVTYFAFLLYIVVMIWAAWAVHAAIHRRARDHHEPLEPGHLAAQDRPRRLDDHAAAAADGQIRARPLLHCEG